MSVKLMSQVWERKLNKAEQSVLLAMADHAQDDGSKCFPSIDWIAWKTDYSARQVQRTIKELCASGVLVLVRGYGRGRANEYRIDLSKTNPKPEYIAKGDTMSPQSNDRKGDTVSLNHTKGDVVSPYMPKHDAVSPQNDAVLPVKGDIYDIKGDIAMSPEPLEPTTETTTTETTERDAANAAPPDTWPDFLIAFCWICHGHKDLGALTEKQKGILTSEAKRIYDKSYTIDDLRAWFRDTWQKDWHWTKNKQHERPKPSDVRSMIPAMRTNGYHPYRNEVDFMPGAPMAPAPQAQPPPGSPLGAPPMPGAPFGPDPWRVLLAELLPTLSSQAADWLRDSRLSDEAELAGEPFYQVLVTHPNANLQWLDRLEPAIRKKLSCLLHKRLSVGFVAAQPGAPLGPAPEPTV